MISRIDHVSIAVRDYEKAYHFFVDVLGAIPGAEGEDAGIKYLWRVFSLGDLSRIELLKMTAEGSFLKGFLAKREGGVHHITLETPDIAKCIRHLDTHSIPYFGYRERSDPNGDNYKELFIHPRNAFGVLIQIAEMNPARYLNSDVKLPEGSRWRIEKTASGSRLTLSHPGGGNVMLEMSCDEMKHLASMLQEALD
jgi:methylmalonyl-CoA/ethylmalonyl-CoA epimerase